MTPEQQRTALKRVYGNETWAKKVDNMSDGQVAVIFIRMRDSGKLTPKLEVPKGWCKAVNKKPEFKTKTVEEPKTNQETYMEPLF